MYILGQYSAKRWVTNAKLIRNIYLQTAGGKKKSEHIICPLIPGDGVGPELMDSVQEVMKAMSIPVKFVEYKIPIDNADAMAEAVRSVCRYGVCLKSAFKSNRPTPDDYPNLDVKIRNVLDLYANVTHIHSLSGVETRHKNIDFYVIREQTEAAYMNLEHETVKGVAECFKIVTAVKSRRIAKFAFDYATRFNRKKVVCVHKANIMKLVDGLFLKCCKDISELYPNIEFESMIVDNCSMQLLSNPSQFDVLVTPNLYGNIIDNLSAGLVGGAGVVPGAEYSDRCVVFEPAAHHTFMQGAGKNIANPTAMLLCASMMLTHVNLRKSRTLLDSAIYDVLKEGKIRTKDIGGTSGTKEFTSAVINAIKQRSK